MTPLHQAATMALDALDAITYDVDGTGLNTMPSFDKAIDAIAALREALAAPEPEPVALESVHLTRDTRGMCVVRVNGRVAIRDNGDIIDHMATLEWFAAPPAAPAPTVPNGCEKIFTHKWLDPDCIERGCKSLAAPPAAPATAAPVPDGWVMVPKEATREMCVAAVVLNNGNAVYKNVAAEALEIEEQIYGEVWIAMIAASPAAPVVREPFSRAQLHRLYVNSPELHKDTASEAAFTRIVQLTEAAHGITGGSNAT